MLLRRLELGCLALGLAAALCYAGYRVPGVLARNERLAPQVANTDEIIVPDTLASAYLKHHASTAESSVIGSLSIAPLRLDAPIVEGVSTADLRRGIGHVPGSAFAGGLGNMVLAAHRDAIFRPLREVRPGMIVRVRGADGTYAYQVDSTKIVTPEALEVMDIGATPEVTLITCYPFNYVGAAPMRFIVKAHLVSALPE